MIELGLKTEKLFRRTRNALAAALLLYTANFTPFVSQTTTGRTTSADTQSRQALIEFIEEERSLNVDAANVSYGIRGELIESENEYDEYVGEFYRNTGDIQDFIAGRDLLNRFMTENVTQTIGIFDLGVYGDGSDCVAGDIPFSQTPLKLNIDNTLLSGESNLKETHGQEVTSNIYAHKSPNVHFKILALDALWNVSSYSHATDYYQLPNCLQAEYTETQFEHLKEFTSMTKTIDLLYGGQSLKEAFGRFFEEEIDGFSASIHFNPSLEDTYAQIFETQIREAILKDPNLILSFAAGNNGNFTDANWRKWPQMYPNNVMLSAAVMYTGAPSVFTSKNVYSLGVAGIGEGAIVLKSVWDKNNNGVQDDTEQTQITDENPYNDFEDVGYAPAAEKGTSFSQPTNLAIGLHIKSLIETLHITETTPIQILYESAIMPDRYRTGVDYDANTNTHSLLGHGIVNMLNAVLKVYDLADVFGRHSSELTEAHMENRENFEKYFQEYYGVKPENDIDWDQIFNLIDNKYPVSDYLVSLGNRIFLPIISNQGIVYFKAN